MLKKYMYNWISHKSLAELLCQLYTEFISWKCM